MRSNNYSAGAVSGEVTMTLGNSSGNGQDAFSVVNFGTGGTGIYRADSTFASGWCGEMTQATAANQPVTTELRETAGDVNIAARIYLILTGYPSALIAFPFQPRSTADAQMGAVNMNTDGTLRLITSGATTVATGTQAVPLNTLVRIEMLYTGYNGASGAWTAAHYAGHSTSPAGGETLSATGLTTAAIVDRVRAGRMGTATLASWRQSGFVIQTAATSFIGPVAGAKPRPILVRSVAVTRGANY